MTKDFSITLLDGWLRAPGTRPWISTLGPHEKLLLFSDGSLTLELELLYGSKVEAEVLYRGFTVLSPEMAEFLLLDQENESIEREVWLTVDNKRLVYAHTIIPLSCLSKGLFNVLERSENEPLGKVLSAMKVPFVKSDIEVALVACEAVSSGLGLDPSTALVARRYILSNPDHDSNPLIKAAVLEVFSPWVVRAEGADKGKGKG